MLQSFSFNPLATNTYVLWDDTRQAIVIDPACCSRSEQDTLRKYIDDNALTVTHILLTHFHFDHVFGLPFVETLTGVRNQAHPADKWWETYNADQVASFGLPLSVADATIGTPLSDGQLITFGHTTLRCIHTPGHSPGSVSFYCAEDNIVFVGDTLFAYGGMGRSDLHGGDWNQLMTSIHEVLFALPPETKVYPGHGPATTLAAERRFHMND